MESYFSISTPFNNVLIVEKSRFLGYAYHVETEQEAEKFIKQLHEQYKDARHICYAYALQNTAKFSDDGEPVGTAGKPILEILKKRNLSNILVVVVRYFGGVKLGAGRLLRTYANCAKELIDGANICEYFSAKICETHLDYKAYQFFSNKIKNSKIKILETNFDDGVYIKFVARDDENIENATILESVMYCF